MENIYIHGYKVQYDDEDPIIDYAISYLKSDLSREEAKVFFIAAKYVGEAQFENDYEYQFTLSYDAYTYVYTLTKRY